MIAQERVSFFFRDWVLLRLVWSMVSARGVGRGWGELDGLEFPLERKQVSTRDKNEGLNGGGGVHMSVVG